MELVTKKSIRIVALALVAVLLVSFPAFAFTYTVQKGDSLYALSQRYDVTISQIKTANKLTSNTIFPGQKVWIPQQSVYTVKRGDTLYLIAKRYGTSHWKIMQANGLKSATIYPGQVLYIPTTRTTTTASRGYGNVNRDDYRYLARLVYGEARGEPFEGQVAVAAVVLNRVKSPRFPNTIRGVIFQPYAFTAVSDGQIWLQPNSTAYRAVDLAMKGWDPTNGALYYWNPATATSKWIWSRTITTQIGNHVFGI